MFQIDSTNIYNFMTVFGTISDFVKCKNCNGNFNFETASERGIGCKIVFVYESCRRAFVWVWRIYEKMAMKKGRSKK